MELFVPSIQGYIPYNLNTEVNIRNDTGNKYHSLSFDNQNDEQLF